MSETVKYRNFCSGPIENKPISAVPGVGPAAVDKFKKKNITKAWQLYQQLQKLNFDLQKFQVWLKINCPGAKGEYIFKAMMETRSQFYENGGPGNGPNAPRPQAETSAGRGGRRDAKAAGARSKSRSFVAAARSSQQNGQSNAESPLTDNPLQLFFASFADSCKEILPKFHTALKMEILGIVGKYEEKSRESEFAHPHPPAPAPAPAPVASTSQNGA